MIFPSESLVGTRSRVMRDLDGGKIPSERAYRKLLEDDHNDLFGLAGLGELCREAGDLTGASEYFWRAVESQPCFSLPYLQLWHIETERGQTALANGLGELGLRKLLLDPTSLEEIEGNPELMQDFGVEGLEELEGSERLEAIASSLRDRRDLEPVEVTARLRPYRLVHQIHEAEDLDPELIDVVVREGEAIVPLLAGILRGYAESPLFTDDEWVVENTLALLGEIGSPSAIPHLLEFIGLDDDNLAGAAGWGIDRIIELQPDAAAEAMLSMAPDLDVYARLAITERLLGWPRWPASERLLERLTENADRLTPEDRNLLFPVLVTTMVAAQGRPGVELARRTLRRNATLLSRSIRRECDDLIEAASEVAASAASVLERPQWTVYQICAGEVVWPSGEDGDEDDEDDEDDLDTVLSNAEPVRRPFTPGRNDPCWCGSGKKYKKCHLNA